MASTFRDIAEYRLRQHADALAKGAATTDDLVVPAIAADLLAALYDLTLYWRDQDTPRYDRLRRSSDDGRIVGGLIHLRGEATHDALVAGDFTDSFAGRFYDHFGCWTWYAGPTPAEDHGIGKMYREHIAGQDVAVTLPAITRFVLHTVPEGFSRPA